MRDGGVQTYEFDDFCEENSSFGVGVIKGLKAPQYIQNGYVLYLWMG